MNKNEDPLSAAVAELRVSYALASLGIADCAADPFAQFRRWMEEAIAACLPEPNAMVLATATADGTPAARTVLLKGIDDRGLVFFTSYTSRKAREMGENPRAGVCFLWKELERQARVAGTVEQTSREESANYFHSRPRGHQIGAWVSQQSSVIPDRQWMVEREREFHTRFPAEGGPVPLPDFWGGYRLIPNAFEFWQGRASRLHDRIEYVPADAGGWQRRRLSP